MPAGEKTKETEDRRIAEAVAAASKSDAVLLVMGGNEKTCREAFSNGHWGDRNDLNLLGRQDDLARAILALGKPTVVLLINGRPLAINELSKTAPAILEGWYLGQGQGNAVANVFFGKVNPSGKLTVTFPRLVGDLPVCYNRKPLVHEHDYISGPFKPLGQGLSYTQFKYDGLAISPVSAKPGESIKVDMKVSNIGKVAGDEIVQLYIRDVIGSVTRPIMELKVFQLTPPAPGETKTVSFIITPDKLQFHDIDMKRVGKAIALEQQSRGRHRIAGPVLDLLHDPRNGRASETICEDPFLGGRIVEGFLHGMNETAVFATIKHYNLNTAAGNIIRTKMLSGMIDGHSSSAVIPSYIITPRQGLEALLGTERVSYAKGCDINSKDRGQFEEATRIAKASDVVIFVGGLDATVEGEEHFIKGDRLTGSADLPGVQNDLINALATANPNMVHDVTTGVGYRWYDQQKLQPEFAFGSGLSYTTFEYKNLRVSPGKTSAGKEVIVRVDVTNTGNRSGEEVTKLYLSTGEITPAAAMPVKQLRGFSKVSIEPGRTREVTLTLGPDEFYIFDPSSGSYQVPTGS